MYTSVYQKKQRSIPALSIYLEPEERKFGEDEEKDMPFVKEVIAWKGDLAKVEDIECPEGFVKMEEWDRDRRVKKSVIAKAMKRMTPIILKND